MLKLFNRKKKDNKGFTLVELVIVVAILAILVGILAPQYTKYVEKSRKSADVSNLENLVTAFKTAEADGTTDIKAGTYGIIISNKKDGTVAGTASKAGGAKDITVTSDATIEDLLASFAGKDWKSTKLKSAKWTEDLQSKGEALDHIDATIVVENDGSVTVSYYPTWVKNMADQAVTTPKAEG